MPNSVLSPQQEMAQRAAETIPGLAAAAAAVGLEDHRRMLRDNSTRLRQGHDAMLRAAGISDPAQSPEDDDVGDIIITGDITRTAGDTTPMPWDRGGQAAAAVQPSAPSSAGGVLEKLGMGAAIAAAATGGGAGGALLVNALNKPPAAIVQPATQAETPWDLKLIPEPPAPAAAGK